MERKQTSKEPQDIRNDAVVSPLIHPRLGAEEASSLEMLKGTDQNLPSKSLLSLAQGPGKGHAGMTEDV